MKTSLRLVLCFLLLAGVLWPAQKTPTDSAKQAKAVDPCKVLTGAEIQAVQGDPLQETKPSTQPSGGLVMLQCLFRTANPNKSVSLSITSAGSVSPRAFWLKQFHSGNPESGEKDKDKDKAAAGRKNAKEEDEESTRPRVIKGLGEQAYWVGSPMVGALYVLKGNTFLRISIGGIREESARIEKSIALARLALKRL